MMIKNTGLAAALLGATLFSTAAVAETNIVIGTGGETGVY